jgi:formimidoylglutamate deiminase
LSLFLAEESMKVYQCERLFTGSNWLTDVYIHLDSDGTITSISQTSEQNAIEKLSGAVVPGMINLHSHAFQRSIAGLSEYKGNPQDSFWSWRDIMYRFVEQLSADDFHTIASQLYVEMLKAGYTSCVEFHYTHHQADGSHYDNVAELSLQVMGAAQKVGIRQTHCPVFYAWSGFGQQPPNQGQRRFINSIQSYHSILNAVADKASSSDILSFGIAPHSLRAADKEQISQIIDHLDQHNAQAPIHIHISEQVKEVEDCLKYYGKRPVEWLYSQFDVNQRWCLVHATHLTSEETQQIAKSGAVAGLCITTEANLGDGIFPIQSYLEHGGTWGIGSDSHISISPVEELRWLEYQNRLLTRQRAVLASEQSKHIGTTLYAQALQGGAQALGQAVGAIEVGRKADWLVLDTQSALLIGMADEFILDAWLFSGNQNVVKDVYVNGECVVENYQHSQQAEIVSQYKAVIKRLLSSKG